MSAPAALLEAIKDDLGITDSSSDAWLTRQLDNIWSRIEHYTSRKLHSPPAAYVDDWQRMVLNGAQQPTPPPLAFTVRVSPFLRYFPVTAIDAIEIDGTPGDPTKVMFAPNSGKLFSLTGGGAGGFAEDLSAQLYMTRTKITYKTGWATVPGDLYAVVLGSITPLWNQRLAQQAAGAGGLGGVTSINVVDVGSVELGGRSFADAAASSSSPRADPMLGPWVNYLDLYVDHRSLVGDALNPVTEPVPVVAAAEPEAPPP